MKAREVLDKYVFLMTGGGHSIDIAVWPEKFIVPEHEKDDAYIIDIENGRGFIYASNRRAALIAAYHSLREFGCGFTRPGEGAEVIPERDISELNCRLQVTNAHRFRGICIEGTVSVDVALDLLEWMPKVGLNSYFMQFMEGYEFFERFYDGKKNPTRTATDFNLEICRGIVRRIIQKAESLGLMYHGVGHGFTCECYGVKGLGWDAMPGSWPEEHKNELALLDGKRELRWDVPLLTALCYSNEAVRRRVAEWTADYIQSHPEYDYVHFWLDDGHNNKCECDNCRDVKIADWYILLLNELDKCLHEKGNNTKVVFLVYHETLWAPEREILANPSRFTFMYAPIQRSFREPLGDAGKAPEPRPYTLNRQPFPENNPEMISHLAAWNVYRKKTGMDMNDSFDFDYYFNVFNDPGQFFMARLVHEDISMLRINGLNGIINCQSQRLFAHAALPMYTYAAALLQPERRFDEIADEFFRGAFGKQGGPVFREYFEKLTAASFSLRTKDETDFSDIEALLSEPIPAHEAKCLGAAESVRLLRFTLELYKHIVAMVKARRSGDKEGYEKLKEEAGVFCRAKEKEFETAFENYYFHVPR